MYDDDDDEDEDEDESLKGVKKFRNLSITAILDVSQKFTFPSLLTQRVKRRFEMVLETALFTADGAAVEDLDWKVTLLDHDLCGDVVADFLDLDLETPLDGAGGGGGG